MNFLAPLFLAGAVAVALPVVFHLIRRTTRQRTVFSSLMFLKVTPPRLTRRSRLEDILLLLLRCAVLCLLALGFARPFIKNVAPETPATEPPKRLILLVDTSASMRRSDLWSQTRKRVDAILQKASAADHVALYMFDQQLKPLVTFEQWDAAVASDRAAFARDLLAKVEPGWAATRIDQAVIRASEMFSESENGDAAGPRRIVLISDFQEGSKLGALQGHDWPKGVEVVSEPVAAKTSNAGLQLLADSEGAETSKVRVRVSNAADARREQFEVGWAQPNGAFVGKPSEIYVPAGQSRIVTLASPETNSVADRITLRGDDEAFDDTVFTVPPVSSRVSVIYLGSETESDTRAPLYFLRRALQGLPGQTVQVLAKASTSSREETAATMLYVVTEAMTGPLASDLRAQASLGKTVLFAPKTATAASTLGNLLGKGSVPVEEVVPRNYAILGEIDFRHPLFAPFADARYSDFTKIHFWKYRRIDTSSLPEARIVAKFDDGNAAVMEIPVGKGRVIVFTSGWQPEDSQLALSTKFIPLLSSTLELSGGAGEPVKQFHVGDTVPIPSDWLADNSNTKINLPDGTSAQLASGETNFSQSTMPGIYRVGAGPAARQFAVNLDSAESRTMPLPLDELDRLGSPGAEASEAPTIAAQRKVVLQSAELERRQKLWRWLIVAALVFLLFETGIAGWTARRRIPKAEAAA